MSAGDSDQDVLSATEVRPPVGLWVICVLTGSAVVSVWAAGRVKPLIFYPLLVGGLVGGWASLVGAFCHVPRRSGLMVIPICCAFAVTVGAMVMSAQRQRADIKPANPLAEKLLQQFEQQTDNAPNPVPANCPEWRYLQARYQRTDDSALWLWLTGEVILSGLMAGGVMAVAWRSPMKANRDG